MQSVNIMIKPASGSCNMNCAYCFYNDLIEKRQTKSYGMMSAATLENIIRKALQHAGKECTIAFQGGEPTLIGLAFYRRLIELQKKHNINNISIHNAIQTNGLNLDEQWAAFFKENGFLVGISIDGNKAVHDGLRLDRMGDGTYERVASSARLLEKYNVDFNILTVVTKQAATRIRKLYAHYKKNGWLYMQFIPCLEPLGEQRGSHAFSLTPEIYAEFLKTLFDLWYNDITTGRFVYIREFENLVGMAAGYPPESCNMTGVCSPQYVVEADGSVYPCDFYVLDEYRIGNFNTDSFEQIDARRKESGFIEQSYNNWPGCRECEWYGLCRGGCRRDRETQKGLGANYFCAAYKEFYPYVAERLAFLARDVVNSR